MEAKGGLNDKELRAEQGFCPRLRKRRCVEIFFVNFALVIPKKDELPSECFQV
jgi:hypothetical protein